MAGTSVQFRLPDDRLASAPPEERGTPRDQVRLLVAGDGGIAHSRFDHLAEVLGPGDLVVLNTSPTMPAALPGRRRGHAVTIHFSTRNDNGSWTVELRHQDQRGPILDAVAGEVIQTGPGRIRLEQPAPGQKTGAARLWLARIEGIPNLARHMRRHGAPIRYRYVPQPWPLAAYQNVFADRSRWPGSAEMPSAGRPFTTRVLKRLAASGVGIARLELHTGVSSQESGEPPQAERFRVPAGTARRVNQARREGGRIIAVGTTVTRALESAFAAGVAQPAAGWTDLVLG
ncbi:MAG: S-adenosylmethionine:tRNA ribosyltransferase-isomerase, partial [Acidimicrobiia bacterium]|nr:S-adenosylmethionine:tRNA ribosyltransferase-isomerase [Acidimicrobiia bacterium]